MPEQCQEDEEEEEEEEKKKERRGRGEERWEGGRKPHRSALKRLGWPTPVDEQQRQRQRVPLVVALAGERICFRR